MKEEKRPCPFCKKETTQTKLEEFQTMEVFACPVCKLLNWEDKAKRVA